MIYFKVAESGLFIMVAFVTYAIIFWKYKKSRDAVRQYQDSGNMDENESDSIVQTFLKSRFYVSIIIILTYLMFNTIPFCIFIILNQNGTVEHRDRDTATFSRFRCIWVTPLTL